MADFKKARHRSSIVKRLWGRPLATWGLAFAWASLSFALSAVLLQPARLAAIFRR